MEIFANAAAIVGEGAFGFALANAADALVTAFAFGAACSAMEEVGFQVNAASRTRGLSCGAVVEAHSACAELACIALFAASTAVLVIGEDVFADARAVVGQKSRTLALSADTRLPVLADFAARTAVCGIGLQVDTFFFAVRERATGGRTTLAFARTATLGVFRFGFSDAFCGELVVDAGSASNGTFGEGQAIFGFESDHGPSEITRFIAKTSDSEGLLLTDKVVCVGFAVFTGWAVAVVVFSVADLGVTKAADTGAFVSVIFEGWIRFCCEVKGLTAAVGVALKVVVDDKVAACGFCKAKIGGVFVDGFAGCAELIERALRGDLAVFDGGGACAQEAFSDDEEASVDLFGLVEIFGHGQNRLCAFYAVFFDAIEIFHLA